MFGPRVFPEELLFVGFSASSSSERTMKALIIRIGFWGPLYHIYNKEPQKQYWEFFRPLFYLFRLFCEATFESIGGTVLTITTTHGR